MQECTSLNYHRRPCYIYILCIQCLVRCLQMQAKVKSISCQPQEMPISYLVVALLCLKYYSGARKRDEDWLS